MVTSLGLHLHTAGVDLSPIQPLWIPPNCRFEVDNYELSWPYNEPFDYIHGRELEGAIRDHKQLFRQAFDNLNPNGWFEMAAFEVNTMSDDNTHLKATCLLSSISNIHTSSKIFGKDMTSVSSWRRWMIKAGFVNVKEDDTSLIANKLPQGPWSPDSNLQELGRYHQLNMLEGLSSYTYALFTRVLGWQRIEIEALLAGARRELKHHLITCIHERILCTGKDRRIAQRNSIHAK
ncbi:uncharacterized protein N7446_005016 [Penicillium canescens]|uniref:uncharacterized protein n=1 Tax=Penicillium canescens TaxID=5083 RepID=UPI0026DED5E3|nr:uncharacterized protein N7446_005016 [Penicillium canescens]KAJ6039683.1 hypothetical protein N7444_008588 [Penicillium canescens]KAJ6067979.1 hypothetical protein N7446_005016 [Penicillium canescens]